MPAPTARLAIPQYADSENASFSAQINAVSAAVDAKAMSFISDTFSKRPEPGIKGRYFLATDGKLSGSPEGDLYFDTGAEWVGPRNLITGPPLGSLMDYAANADPVDGDGVTRWLLANGRAIVRATYPAWFAKFGTTFGAGNGSTTVNIPNLIGRVAVHPGGSGVGAVGSTGGEQTHPLTEAEMPKHHHLPLSGTFKIGSIGGTYVDANASPVYPNVYQLADQAQTADAGGGGAHNNMQPYLGLYKIIRVL